MYYDEHVREIVSKIPFDPGIYMMKDENGTIIYVGKAISLRKRVRQYFQKTNKSARIEKMASLVRDISYIVTKNEVEALVLECNYIKEHNPKFNVMLKDDKTYPYIKITVKDKYPIIYVTRTYKKDGSLYFGPYTNVGAMREVLRMVKEIFPVKRCRYNLEKKKITSPCLYYHIGRCLGPCINDVNLNDYKNMIDQVALFLQGKTKQIKEIIEKQIEECIEKLEFEKAAVLKQRLDDIDKISDRQTVANLNENSTDIFGYVLNDNALHVQVFKIRNYKVVLHDNVEIKDVAKEEVEESISQIISRYYLEREDIPKKVYVRLEEENIELLNHFFETKKLKINVFCPKKGEKLNLIKMVENNIHINLEDRKNNALEDLSNLLEFSDTVDSIECYDISNLRNEYIVGCMIRFENGKLNKKMYRKFKIKSTMTQDDPKCMYEVLTRRLRHAKDWPLPDVMLIDGGKTQLGAVKKAMDDIGEHTNFYGMVKNDNHRTRGLMDESGEEFDLSNSKSILKFLTFLQDEVHRFTITYHRSLRDTVKLRDGKVYKK
ncbi:MAG: excinuclease ABC subunit UvrC [Clostridia bacterium]|nr:excinuclease ABC subunit UvrC [Clostridia bacterium]